MRTSLLAALTMITVQLAVAQTVPTDQTWTAEELLLPFKENLPEEEWWRGVLFLQRRLDEGHPAPTFLLRRLARFRAYQRVQAANTVLGSHSKQPDKHAQQPSAQGSPPLFIAGTVTHRVPFASQGNTLDLSISGFTASGDVQVSVRESPAWMEWEPGVQVGVDAEKPAASFTFSVEPTAPVGEVQSVLFDIASTDGRVWTKEILIQVEAPQEVTLFGNYPNPFSARTRIAYDLPAAARVRLIVYDVLGREVARLVDEERPAGRHEVTWETGALASGMYFCRLVTEDANGNQIVKQSKMLLAK